MDGCKLEEFRTITKTSRKLTRFFLLHSSHKIKHSCVRRGQNVNYLSHTATNISTGGIWQTANLIVTIEYTCAAPIGENSLKC